MLMNRQKIGVRVRMGAASRTPGLCMTDSPLLLRLAVALAIGLMIGLERGWKQREEAEGERTAGLRTYTLTALLGGLCAILSGQTHPAFLALSFFSFAIAFSAFSWLQAKAENNFSVTGV